jgi:hypothetical protein
MIQHIFMYSSVVFFIVAILLKTFYIKIAFLLLCVSSTIFHMLDHEIQDPHEDIMKYIYHIDISIIFMISTYIIIENQLYAFICYIIYISLLFIGFQYNYTLTLLSYGIAWFKVIYAIFKNTNEKLIFITLLFVNIIMLLNNHKKYHKYPYHTSWNKQNAFVWHFINAVILYIGLNKLHIN